MIRVDSVRIQNFRSIKDSTEVSLEQDVTGLIGRNESGKTNFLKGLQSFNQDYSYSQEDLCTLSFPTGYPGTDEANIPIVTIEFSGSIAISEGLEMDLSNFKVTKYYDNHYEVVQKEESEDIEDIFDDLQKELTDQTRGKILDILNELEQRENFRNELGDNIDNSKFNLMKSDVEDIADLEDLKNTLSDVIDGLSDMENDAKEELSKDAITVARRAISDLNQNNNLFDESQSTSTDPPAANILALDIIDKDDFLNQTPRFILHENVDHIQDSLTISDIHDKNEDSKTFQNLMKLTGLDIDMLDQATQGQRLPLTNNASTEITGQVNENWSQENYNIEINADGTNLSVYVADEGGSMNQPSKRSKGFQWFLSFYINFMSGTKREMEDSVLLLDDPGVFLHPSGQKDLLNTLDKLTDNNQVIYNTHSPFLIDQDHLERIRILEKKEDGEGTKVTEEFHKRRGDVLAPIRAAIGATISDSLFGNQKNALVEGYSDKLALESISQYFRKRNKQNQTIDPESISIINVGGAPKMPYFAKLIEAENYEYMILMDADNQGRQQKDVLEREEKIPDECIYLLDDIIESLEGHDATTEDMFSEDFYLYAVKSAYKDQIDNDKLDDLDTIESGGRGIVGVVSEFFSDNDLGTFQKTKVAKEVRSITKQPDCDDDRLGENTIENFGEVFEKINDALDE